MKNELLGIDLVEFSEIERRLSDKFVARVLSVEERKLYDRMSDDKRKLSFIAGRFAAKEAYTKAYRSFAQPLNMNEVSVLNDSDGAPYLTSPYRPRDTVEISISHSPNYAVAICLVRKEED